MRPSSSLLLAVAGPAAAGPPPEAVALQNHLRQVIKTAKPSVACVLVSRSNQYAEFRQGPSAADQGKLGEFHPPPTSRFADARQRELVRRLDLAHPDTVPESYGSGVVIDDRGLVLTTYHVIAGATKVFVRLPGAGRASYADILAADPRADLAVLKMIHAPADLKAIPMGDGGKVDQGDWVVALSNPFAAGFKDGNPSASWGIIANTPAALLRGRRRDPAGQAAGPVRHPVGDRRPAQPRLLRRGPPEHGRRTDRADLGPGGRHRRGGGRRLRHPDGRQHQEDDRRAQARRGD